MLVRAWSGSWVYFIGDSTHRNIHDEVLGLVAGLGVNVTTALPQIGGLDVRDRDQQKDRDTVASWHSKRAWRCAQSPCGNGTGNGTGMPPPALISFRFLRGLDMHKLEHHARDWRQRFLYPDWRSISPEAPPQMLMQSDPSNMHPLTRRYFGRLAEPDVIVFHACAWDLPHINRSHFYYKFMLPGYGPCKGQPPPHAAAVSLQHRLPNGTFAFGVANTTVVGSPCSLRGSNLTDQQIFDGFAAKLREALSLLRERFGGRLVVRSCHAGTQQTLERKHNVKRQHVQSQFAALVTMDAVIRRVAAALCVELLDVMAMDAASGYHYSTTADDFHVPRGASITAARATLAMLAPRAQMNGAMVKPLGQPDQKCGFEDK